MIATPGSPDETDEAPVPAGEPAAVSRGQKFWAVALVLDAFFVIIFGGALAAKLYQHLQAPPPPPPPRHVRPVKPPEPAKPEEAPKPAPAPSPKAAAPKPGAPPAKAGPGAGMRPPKPSMLTETPRHEAAKPSEAPAAGAADAKVKALAVEFHIKAPNAQRVELAGPFIVRGGRKPMSDRGGGQWALTLYLTPNTYRYHFLVDGKKTLDPENPKTDRGASVVTVP